MRSLLTSFLNYNLLLVISSLLRVLQACNPALRAPYVHTLTRRGCTVVIWPEHHRTPQHPQDDQRTSMDMHST